MSRKRTLAAACLAAAVAWILFRSCAQRRPPGREYTEPIPVRRGNLQFVLREAGELLPREPVLVKSRHNGIIQWIVEDGAWVEKDERLFVVSEEEELQRVAEMRNELLNARQELRLARARREHAAELEARKLAASVRACELEQVRYRVLTTPPQCGDELVRIHETLVGMEQQTHRVRLKYEEAQGGYEEAQDAYLDALDAWQAQRDNILQAQSRIDELEAEKDRDVSKLQEHELKKHEEDMQELEKQRQAMKEFRDGLPALLEKLAAARAARDAKKGPRDAVAAELAAREGEEKETYIRLEIEKRGVPLALLRLDDQATRLTLEEARRKQQNGAEAFEAGSISRATLDDLESAVKTAETRLRIVEQKVKMAEAPPPPAELEEAKSKLERAEASARSAQEVHDRALKIQDTELQMLEARLAQLSEEIERRSRNFPAIIESNLEFARKDLELLDEDETERRRELTEETARLEKDLAAAQQDPPNIAKAPISGIAQVLYRDQRPLQAGDEAREDSVVVRLYPPQNMEVQVGINEVNRQHLRRDMPVRVTIPALRKAVGGRIYQIAGVGKDKLQAASRWAGGAFADVTQFDVRIRLDEATAEFRQGMTVMVDIIVERRPNVLWLPIGAVRTVEGRHLVLTGWQRHPREKAIQGEPFAEDAFVVRAGIEEGDHVFVRRTRNL